MRRRRSRSVRVGAVAVMVALTATLAACGGNDVSAGQRPGAEPPTGLPLSPGEPFSPGQPDQGSGPAEQGPDPAEQGFGLTDVSFATHMLPALEFEVQLAQLAVEKTQSPEVRSLAHSSLETLTREIGTLRELLTKYGVVPSAAVFPPVHQHHNERELGVLRASGPEFDCRWLDVYLNFHLEDLTIAEIELQAGKGQRARILAQEIDHLFTEEAEQMLGLLDRFGCP